MHDGPLDTALSALREHATLEMVHEDGGAGDFLSGWQCVNLWAEVIDGAISSARQGLPGNRYYYLEDDEHSLELINRLHLEWDNLRPPALVLSMGSTPILFAFCAHLRATGIEEVFYVPPLYFSLHAALRLLGLRSRPISGKHGFEVDFEPVLPDRRCVLILCDPVWYAGVSLSAAFIERLRDWQAATGSLIFVDGSFQYMRWDGSTFERTSMLDPGATVRLICPTKALAAHGYRFAYAIVPAAMRMGLAHENTRMHGSSSMDSIAMARVAPRLLRERTITSGLMRGAAEAHKRHRAEGNISAPWSPEAGYFSFEKLRPGKREEMLLMGQEYFEQTAFPDFVRINLLSPSLASLD